MRTRKNIKSQSGVYYYSKRRRIYRNIESERIMGLKKATFRDVCYLIAFALIGVGVINTFDKNLNYVARYSYSYSVPKVMAKTETAPTKVMLDSINLPTPTPTPTIAPTPNPVIADPSNAQVVTEIKRVFGPDAPKAFLLLSGRPDICSENATLNPQAVNYRNPDGSSDWGLFQINSYWHGFLLPVNNREYLFDYRINVAMAYHIYIASGHSFNLWTCGKELGI